MSSDVVKNIYETLSSAESKLNPDEAYPIHKKLNFGSESGFNDVYDWIINKINIPHSGSILDVGCGVGYGCFFLYERTDCLSKGISLSENEIQIAQKIAIAKGLQDRCTFMVQNFDHPIQEKYDLILAVESIKHSIDLPRTIENLVQALRPDGKLIIVEDFFIKEESTYLFKTLLRDWCLQKAYTTEDYLRKLESYPNLEMKLHDLTQFLMHKNSVRLYFQFAVSMIRSYLEGKVNRNSIWSIMRGGYALEFLYKSKLVKYQVLEVSLSESVVQFF